MQHSEFMQSALAESMKSLPRCRPNPPVGCVLIEKGKVIALGHTQKPGDMHAEANALSKVKGNLSEISAYVTLEPCSFHGRTPSCAEALIERNIGKVYVAIRDPDHRNNGKGISMLRNAGIEVIEGVLSNEVQEFIGPFLNES